MQTKDHTVWQPGEVVMRKSVFVDELIIYPQLADPRLWWFPLQGFTGIADMAILDMVIQGGVDESA
jgi:hypothetical protein